MDREVREEVRQAQRREVGAFVALTRRFQHFAFGSALTLVHDFQTAEDVVQEAFLAAWAALPGLADPAAFPGWLRAIVRRKAFRVLRQRQLDWRPLAEAEEVPDESALPDRALEARRQAAAALAAIGQMPDPVREPAILYFVHECSHQDIANFLGLTPATVNNRLHAARSMLKERRLTMIETTLPGQALPDDFANRIGRLVEASGPLVEILFDPAALPDLLTELVVSDEAGAVTVQVVQRAEGGIVRAVMSAPSGTLRRGSTVLNSGRHASASVGRDNLGLVVAQLAGPSPLDAGTPPLLETGIKVIDLLCPLLAGGRALIVGEARTGTMVLMEELVRRLADAGPALSLVVMMPPAATWGRHAGAEFTYARALAEDGFSEGSKGGVQTFFLRGPDAVWTAESLPGPEQADAVIRLSPAQAQAQIWPAIEPASSTSRAFESEAVDEGHRKLATRARQALARLTGDPDAAGVEAERARKLRLFLTQPFFVAEPFTQQPGRFVRLEDTLAGCRAILDGGCDELPTAAFLFGGGIDEIRQRSGT
jgi:RNA polymerase sigma factor (sigma-70 family)